MYCTGQTILITHATVDSLGGGSDNDMAPTCSLSTDPGGNWQLEYYEFMADYESKGQGIIKIPFKRD